MSSDSDTYLLSERPKHDSSKEPVEKSEASFICFEGKAASYKVSSREDVCNPVATYSCTANWHRQCVAEEYWKTSDKIKPLKRAYLLVGKMF